jgi:hypothetical protein
VLLLLLLPLLLLVLAFRPLLSSVLQGRFSATQLPTLLS